MRDTRITCNERLLESLGGLVGRRPGPSPEGVGPGNTNQLYTASTPKSRVNLEQYGARRHLSTVHTETMNSERKTPLPSNNIHVVTIGKPF